MSDPTEFLGRSDRVYQRLVRRVQARRARGDVAGTLRAARDAACLACFAHTGRYADGAIENVLLEIGQARVAAAHPRDEGAVRGRVLHVVTRVLPTGGHTRLLANWIRNDTAHVHSLVVLDQPPETVPALVRDAVAAAGGRVVVLPRRMPHLAKAQRLRALAHAEAEAVILHVHQFDVVPVLAFAAPGGPPVALVNHSDHTFWLGSSVADVVVPFREFSERLGARRFARAQHLVPIPLQPPRPTATREEARRSLGIADDEVVLLTISARYKLEPTATHDFFVRCAAILAAHPRARLFVVGFGPDAVPPSGAALRASPRAHFVGLLPQPEVYQRAADIFLEGFPLGSLTALLESVALGAAPVVMHDPPSVQLDVSDDPGLLGWSTPAVGTAAYDAAVGALIDDDERRRATAAGASAAMIHAHSGDGWRGVVDRLHRRLVAIGHHPAPLPRTASLAEGPDLARAEWDAHLLTGHPLAVTAAREARRPGDLVAILASSLRAGDTTLRVRHLRAWASVVRRRVLADAIE